MTGPLDVPAQVRMGFLSEKIRLTTLPSETRMENLRSSSLIDGCRSRSEGSCTKPRLLRQGKPG